MTKKTYFILGKLNFMMSPSSLTARAQIILLAIGVLIFIMNIDYTAVNLALLPISEETKGDLNLLQWLLSGYVLIWAALVVPAGRFADIYGKKQSLLLGVSIFMIGSFLTGFGHNALLLIIGRLIQGLGAALFSAPAYGLLFTSVPKNKQGVAIGFIGGCAALGLAIGPTLAGWIIKEIGWRWIFYINIPLGFMVILVLSIYAPFEKKIDHHHQIDGLSVLLLTCGLGSFVFALNQVEVWGINDPFLLSFGITGLFLLTLFSYRDRNQTFQILPRAILHNKPYMGAVITVFLLAYCFALILVMMSLYLQNTLKLSSYMTGLYFLPMTLAMGILSPIGGKLADHIDIRIPIITGTLLTLCGLVILTFLHEGTPPLHVFLGLCLTGIGLGVVFPCLNTAMFRTLNPSDINTGSAIFTMSMTLSNGVSVIISTSALVIFGRTKLMNHIAHMGHTLTQEEEQALTKIMSSVEHTAEQLKQFPTEKIPTLLQAVDQGFLYGFRATLWIGIVLSLFSILIFLKCFRNFHQKRSTPHIMLP